MITGVDAQWTVDSESGVLRDVLLCRPEYFAWQPTNSVALKTLADEKMGFDPVVAKEQYQGLVDALEGQGVNCHYLNPSPHLPYQIYTRDSSQVTPWGPVITQLFRPQRRGEYAEVLEFYHQGGGAGPWGYSTSGTLEGGDIHIIRPGLLLIGHSGERTDEDGAQQMGAWFKERGWDVRVESFPEHFLHMDVIFCMVTPNLAVACADVLDQGFMDWLKEHQIRLIPVSYKDAMKLSCNVLALGNDRIISASHSVHMNAALKAEGISVIDIPLDQFTRGGGGVHCMTMPLRRDPI